MSNCMRGITFDNKEDLKNWLNHIFDSRSGDIWRNAIDKYVERVEEEITYKHGSGTYKKNGNQSVSQASPSNSSPTICSNDAIHLYETHFHLHFAEIFKCETSDLSPHKKVFLYHGGNDR
ncbi:hypothetical protein TNIN_407081 [Trichonephila inaurata madagascariensis]|uniref:Uncharacterized protein n=1 Tax=Trichonephila inaurata madagascariensis TaxID=2747483 RepID=A0A8X7CQN5_9ARAC|nr:hypothetical protein TNIN_407081 [Trichonephila inaurata madagascariensis]